MQLTSDVMTIAILAFPGLTASYIYRQLREAKPKPNWAIVFESIVFSVMSCTIWFLLTALLARRWPTIAAFSGALQFNAITENIPIGLIQPSMAILLLGATVISAALALLAAFVHNRKYIINLGRHLNIAERDGEADVLDAFLAEIPAPVVRDANTKRTYYGTLTRYSKTTETCEIALENVQVYDEGGKRLYVLRTLYISRPPGDITLEFKPTNPI